MQFLTVSFLSFIFTIFLTQYLIRISTSKGILDRPNGEKRRIHDQPVPRLGGLIIIPVVIIISFIFFQDIWSRRYFVTGLLMVFGVGLWDDLKTQKWYVKLIFQTMAAHFLILSMQLHNFTIVNLAGLELPAGINYFILMGLIIGIINAFNMLDGLDGLVTGLTLIISGMVFILSLKNNYVFVPTLAAALIGASLGFLKFNANPARIFLGDSGSLSLGFIITTLLLALSNTMLYHVDAEPYGRTFSVDLMFVIIVLAVPITDTLRVMFLRMKNRKSPFLPDKNHLHHLLYSKRIRHKTVVLLINAFSAGFALLGAYYLYVSKFYAIIFFVLMLLALLSTDKIIDAVIRKENLLAFGRLYRKIPASLPSIYKNLVLPLLGIGIAVFMLLLLINEIETSRSYYLYILLFQVPVLAYAVINFRKTFHYVDLIVFLNFIIFFIVTGLNGFFYDMYPVPLIEQVNINQVFILLFSIVIILFILFKERIANVRTQFLTGADLAIALTITFVFILSQLVDMQQAYKISDILLRSFLLFLFYKIAVITYPRFHYSLHFTSFAFSFASLLRAVI